MRRLFALTITLCLIGSLAAAHAETWDLRVSENGRFLTKATGVPFFWLGDTAWELFHRLNREEADRYLENRKQKKFTVIQAVALAELDGLDTPNAYGEKPLIGNDPTRPNARYFEHVDWIVNRAREKGLYIGMLPTWGNKVVKGSWEKTPQVIFNSQNARVYGKWIGTRYKDTPNLVWILGGDRNPEGVVEVWRAMAEGIKEGDKGRHLITFHPNGGGSSATVLHVEHWLDFNMIQSGHRAKDLPNYQLIAKEYARTPVKPILDGEPRYEDHPVNWKPQEQGWFDEVDVRQAAYWAVMAGAFGHTYGCHPIWQMASPKWPKIGQARHEWTEVLDLPGASQMQHLRAVIESRDFLSRVPDTNLIVNNPEGADHAAASRGDGYIMVYIPTGKPVEVKLQGYRRGGAVRAWFVTWVDPRTGEFKQGAEMPGKPTFTLTPPGTPGRGNDWVVILDAMAR
ncbi:MAG: glycoside hydrolase family 140 protein [Bryobacterales bacterium]|nr:glycoside hydrolase family 140 protein [Bryobacterales bacterium]